MPIDKISKDSSRVQFKKHDVEDLQFYLERDTIPYLDTFHAVNVNKRKQQCQYCSEWFKETSSKKEFKEFKESNITSLVDIFCY